MTLEEQIRTLEDQLKQLYLDMAATCKNGSSFKDEYRLQGIDDRLAKIQADVAGVRGKLAGLRKQLLVEWSKVDKGYPKSPYD